MSFKFSQKSIHPQIIQFHDLFFFYLGPRENNSRIAQSSSTLAHPPTRDTYRAIPLPKFNRILYSVPFAAGRHTWMRIRKDCTNSRVSFTLISLWKKKTRVHLENRTLYKTGVMVGVVTFVLFSHARKWVILSRPLVS